MCLDCHTDKAGPFVYPHAPREVGPRTLGNGCLSCHVQHGTPNPRLLTRRDIRSICLECHTNLPAFHDQTRARFRNCITCHIAIHGSNHDVRFFDD